jgi:hypothetical protein
VVRVVLAPREHALELVLHRRRERAAHAAAPSSRPTMLPTGMSIQSGR